MTIDNALASPLDFGQAIDDRIERPPHLELINSKLVDLAAGRIRKLLIQVPPGSGKSSICSRLFPTWYVGLWPDRWVAIVTHEAEFAKKWARDCRDLYTEWGPTYFGHGVRRDVSSSKEWHVAGASGGCLAYGTGGAILGRRLNVLVIDDPVKNQEEARSVAKRENLWAWYQSTARSRMEPEWAIVLIMQRWHQDDIAGRALARETGWEVVRLPALAEANDPLGRAPGEPLWPERFPKEHLLEIQKDTDPVWWASLFQQSPIPEGGEIFRKEWFRYYDV